MEIHATGEFCPNPARRSMAHRRCGAVVLTCGLWLAGGEPGSTGPGSFAASWLRLLLRTVGKPGGYTAGPADLKSACTCVASNDFLDPFDNHRFCDQLHR